MPSPQPLFEHLLPPTLLVISAQTERWVATQNQISLWPVAATLDTCIDPDDALRRINRAQPDLLLVDDALGDEQVLALVQHVTREHPQVEVMTFGNGDADPSYMVWPWTALPSVLDQWIAQYIERSSPDLAGDWFS